MNATSHTEQRLPARQAVSRYWRSLLGVALFPPVALVATNLVQLEPDLAFFLITVFFFASMAPVAWLLITQKVRYSFWLAAICIYFAAGIFTSIIYQIVRAITN